jgi:hypothetical protein
MKLRSTRAAILGVVALTAFARSTPGQKIVERPSSPAGNIFEAAGVVSQLGCRAREIDMQIAAAGSTVRLHAHAGDFRVVMASRPANFRICTSLKGLHAEVQYTPEESNIQRGTLLWLRVESPDERAYDPRPASATSKPGAPMENLGSKGDPTETQTAEGKVTDVVCTGNEMKVTIASGNTPLTLYARDYKRVVYDDDAAFETHDYEPCTNLKGHRATITYVVVLDKPYAGIIQSVEVGQQDGR